MHQHKRGRRQFGRGSIGRIALGVGLVLAAASGFVAAREGEVWDFVSRLGIIMAGVAYLSLRGRSIDEAYRLGYDIGYDRGYDQGNIDCWDARVRDDAGDEGHPVRRRQT